MTRLLMFLVLFAALDVRAGDVSGTVVGVVEGSSNFHFRTSGTHSNKPPCAAPGWFFVDPTTQHGQLMISIVLAAYHSNRPVHLFGTNVCSAAQPNVEVLAHIRTNGV